MPLKLYKVDFAAIEYRRGTIACAVVYSDANRGSLIYLRSSSLFIWRILILYPETGE